MTLILPYPHHPLDQMLHPGQVDLLPGREGRLLQEVEVPLLPAPLFRRRLVAPLRLDPALRRLDQAHPLQDQELRRLHRLEDRMVGRGSWVLCHICMSVVFIILLFPSCPSFCCSWGSFYCYYLFVICPVF